MSDRERVMGGFNAVAIYDGLRIILTFSTVDGLTPMFRWAHAHRFMRTPATRAKYDGRYAIRCECLKHLVKSQCLKHASI